MSDPEGNIIADKSINKSGLPDEVRSASGSRDSPPKASGLEHLRQSRRQTALWAIDFCLGAATLCVYLATERYGAILPWLYTFGLLIAAGAWWDRTSRQDGRLLRLLITSYLAVSLVGMLEVSDNLRQYGTMFGIGADDSDYFFNARTILQDGVIPAGAGLYDLVLAAWGFLPNLIWKETTTAFEFLPLNWALAAAVVGLCDELCFVVLKQRPPLWILALTLLANYKFTDATIHLYRDGLLLTFFLLALNSLMRVQRLRSVLYSLPVLVLRAANFGLYCIVFLLSVALGRARTRVIFYRWVLSFLAPIIGPQVFRYATRITLGGYVDEHIASTLFEEMQFRGEIYALSTGTAQSTTLGYEMANNTAASFVLRPITFELLPIRFWPLEMGGNSASRFAVNISSDRELTLRNVYLWFSIISWVAVLPLLIVGLGVAAAGSRNLNIMFVYYLVSVFAVSFISFELRHATAFITIHPLLALAGYNSVRKHQRVRAFAIGFAVLTAFGICAYNSFAGALL